MNIALGIIFGAITALMSLALGPFMIPTLVLYVVGRRWLTERGKKLRTEATGSAIRVRLWFLSIWGWTWRSALIYLLPFGILAMLTGGNDPMQMGQALAKVIVGWILVGLFCLDAPIWALRELGPVASSVFSKEVYDQIAEEFRTNTCDQGLLLKSLSLAGGDRDKATALYTIERAAWLAAQKAGKFNKPASVTRNSVGAFAVLIFVGIAAFCILLFLTDSGQKLLSEVAQRFMTHPSSITSAQAVPGTTNGTSSSSKDKIWNLPFQFGETKEQVRQELNLAGPDETENADTWESYCAQHPDTHNQVEKASWRRYSPNLEIEFYSKPRLILYFNNQRLIRILLGNFRQSDLSPYQGPIVKWLVLSDSRDVLLRKFGPQNSINPDSVPRSIAGYLKPDPYASNYSWNMGNVYIFVTVRNEDDKADLSKEGLPKDTIESVNIIPNLPTGQYPPMATPYD